MPLAEFNPNAKYGFFGYPGWACESAFTTDDPAIADECIERGFMDANTYAMDNRSMVEYARFRNAPKVEQHLIGLGWK